MYMSMNMRGIGARAVIGWRRRIRRRGAAVVMFALFRAASRFAVSCHQPSTQIYKL